jgi:hypothetical protein
LINWIIFIYIILSIRRWINNLLVLTNESIEIESDNNFLRREQHQVDEPVYEDDFDSFDERDENSRIRQVLKNLISYLITTQIAPHNVQINNTSGS